MTKTSAMEFGTRFFANLSDFGETFANGGRGTPNAFGPILLLLKPDALSSATDVAVTLRSAGEPGFNRERETLCSTSEVERLFRGPSIGKPAGDGKKNPLELFNNTRLKWRKELAKEFADRGVKTPELHCTNQDSLLRVEFIDRMVVDPYRIGRQPLRDVVENLAQGLRLPVPIVQRQTKASRLRLYDELWTLCLGGSLSIEDISSSPSTSMELKDWSRSLLELDSSEQERQFRRYNRYLRNGTIIPVNTHYADDW